MSTWDTYKNRTSVNGTNMRSTSFAREQRFLSQKLMNSLSYHNVTIDGEPRHVSIINSENFNEKTICSMPGEDLKCGGLVDFANNKWLISEKDANNELYTKGKLVQCNYNLKWIDPDGIIHEQWCVIEDGTKYLIGEYEDRNFVVTRGDSRVAMLISRNEHTLKFNRESRFLIDDPLSGDKLSYLLTKPLKVGRVYDNDGIYAFILHEIVSTDDDNMELGIANYYKYFPKEIGNKECNSISDDIVPESHENNSNGRKVWI